MRAPKGGYPTSPEKSGLSGHADIADINACGHIDGMAMLEIPLWLALAMCVPIAVVLALRFRRYHWPKGRTALLAALPGFIMAIALGVWDFTYVIWPDEIDAGGKVSAFLLFLNPQFALVVFVTGYIAARFSLRFRNG